MSKDQMMLITSYWGEDKSFRLMPITEDCLFVEGIYDPSQKVLVMIANRVKETFQMMARLDEQGDQMKLKRPRQNGKPFPEERRVLDTYQEFYIRDTKEIEELINMLAINTSTFDYKSFLTSTGPISIPEQPKISLILP
jgi:hypothetical protein